MTYPHRNPTKVRLEAFQRRAGAIGLLECCNCTYPVKLHDTESQHELGCPAHGMTLSAIAAGTHRRITWSNP